MVHRQSLDFINCDSCGSPAVLALDMGFLPICNDMKQAPDEPATAHPLAIYRCINDGCRLVQTGPAEDSNIVYPPHYAYRSRMSGPLLDQFDQLAEELAPKGGKYVIDIGSNDGSLLERFAVRGNDVLGIEPTDAALAASVLTVNAFFDRHAASRIAADRKADIVTSTNAFAHIPDVAGLCRNVEAILALDGVFVVEVNNLADLIEKNQWDTFYHEHLRYYDPISLRATVERHTKLRLFTIVPIPTHGGSMRAYFRFVDDWEPDMGDVATVLSGMDPMKRFVRRARLSRWKLRMFFHNCKTEGRTIAAIGAPSRASTLVSWCGITRDELPVVYELEGSAKIGRYMPGTNIPVLDQRDLPMAGSESPDFLIVLSWHQFDEIKARLRKAGYVGRIISPLPRLTVDA